MQRPMFVLLSLALLASCRSPEAQSQEQVDAAVSDTVVRSQMAAKPGDPLSPLNKDGTKKDPFAPGRVVELNAVVQRSKDAIDQYDKIRPGIEKLVAAAKAAPASKDLAARARTGITQIEALHAQAAEAKQALSIEGQKLLKSGQFYDTVIFSGMILFVSRVEDELADDIKAMKAATGG
jgi:hypothetical protein